MSDLLINLRFWSWHLQLSKGFRPSLAKNTYHRAAGWPHGYISVYQFFNYSSHE